LSERTRRHPGRTILRHDARTCPLSPARWEDEGRYFRCWNCGMICDVQRDALGGSEDRGGTNSEFVKDTYPDYSGWQDYFDVKKPTLIRGSSHSVMCRLDASGDVVAPRLSYSPTVESGCSFCGSRNWRGDYR